MNLLEKGSFLKIHYRKLLKKYKNPQSAFSLLELSIVILIIAILVASMSSGSLLVFESRLQIARNLTSASPVSSIKNLAMWLETSSTISFDSNSIEDEELPISTWNDINQLLTSKNNATQLVAESRPSYVRDCANLLPCLRFDGVDDFLSYDGSIIANGPYTIFIVEQVADSSNNNYILGTSGSIVTNGNLKVGYYSDGTFSISHSNTGNIFDITIPSFTSKKPAIHTVMFSPSNGRVYYRNSGTKNSKPSADTTLIANDDASIGRMVSDYYNGDICELIIFTRYLTKEEKEEIETYLSKKWKINLDPEGEEQIQEQQEEEVVY